MDVEPKIGNLDVVLCNTTWTNDRVDGTYKSRVLCCKGPGSSSRCTSVFFTTAEQ